MQALLFLVNVIGTPFLKYQMMQRNNLYAKALFEFGAMCQQAGSCNRPRLGVYGSILVNKSRLSSNPKNTCRATTSCVLAKQFYEVNHHCRGISMNLKMISKLNP